MIVSAVITAVAFTTVIVVTLVIANQYKTNRIEVEGKIRNVVDQVNTSQQYTYEFDKRQQQQLTGVQRELEDIKGSYLRKVDAENNISTKRLDVDNVYSNGKINLTSKGSKSGAIQLDSVLDGASNSADYIIQRGATADTKNQIIIQTPMEKGSGLNVMTSDGKSKVLVDSTTGQVNVPGNVKTSTLQLGDKWKLSGVGDAHGNDDWLRFFNKEGTDYRGGIATANLWTRDNAYLNGTVNITGRGNVGGSLYIRGGASEHNPNGWLSHFPWEGDNKNYLRGDTEIRGNTNNIGDLGVGRNLNVTGSSRIEGSTNIKGPVKINHDHGGWLNEATLSSYSEPGKVGASFGSQGWSHFPWSDGNTYIRPGSDNKSINIGDWGAANVNIGRGDTATNINGTLSVYKGNGDWNWMRMYKNDNDQLFFGMDGTNKGIWNHGRDFNIYAGGANRFSVSEDGNIINRGNVSAPSIGRAAGENDWFRINSMNGGNTKHPGTAVYQGMAINDGGGLAVGNWWKVPEGQVNIRDGLKIRHNEGGWMDKSAITTWTPDNNYAGPSFGGPTHWSHFPWFDGNTYIRPGKDKGLVAVGDSGASHVKMGNDISAQQLGSASWLPYFNGDSYIRPGRDEKNIYVGDAWAKEVNLGRFDGSGAVISRPWTTYVRRHLDAWDNWDPSGKTIFTGWYSDKTVLGNNKSAGHDYVKKLPQNVVASANDFYANGKMSATNQLCINDTCLNEGNLKVLKSWL